MHWVLAVINILEKKIQFFDSMGGHDKLSLAHLAQYITAEYMDKRSEIVNGSSWAREIPRDIPRQDNCSDCGVFMVAYAECTGRNCVFDFDQLRMPIMRRRFVAQILKGLVP